MRFDIPAALRAEHDGLHSQLVSAMEEAGPLGEAAQEVARLLHPHFVREEQFALPPLALLADLARGAGSPEMVAVLPMTQRLKDELPAMLDEHRRIVAALAGLRAAARAAGKPRYERFAEALMHHAELEEQVLYPAAILVGEFVKARA